MAKYFGEIGYAKSVETKPGVWEDVITAHNYYGDTIQNTRQTQSTDTLNDNLIVANKISIIADAFANENFYSIRYVVFMKTKWKVSKVDVVFPRLILTLGGVYNGNKA